LRTPTTWRCPREVRIWLSWTASSARSKRCPPGQPPGLRLGLPDPAPDWVGYALGVFEADQRRDGRARRDGQSHFKLKVSGAPEDREVFLEGLGVLREVWPEMAGSVDCLVRVVLWFEPFAGSASLTQAYGAVFIATGRDVPGAIEAIVHETTHLELMARTTVDKLLLNGDDAGASPFR